jgi:HD-like signal output (HDOD) protein
MTNIIGLNELAAEIEHGELVFPTHSHVALQVRMALDDPEIHLEKAATLVQAEPMLAAKVVGFANCTAFNSSGRAVSDVRTAVMRLGMTMVRGLSTALVLRQFSARQSPAHQKLAEQLWEHSAHVAALCHVLARRVCRQNPDVAMFAGIVHEIGGFYLISRASDCPALFAYGMDEAWRMGGEARISKAVLRVLAVPPEIASAVQSLWQGNANLPPKNLTDTLYLANCLTPIANPLQPVSAEMERLATVALSTQVIGDQTLASILEESTDELSALADSLSFS